MIPSRREHSLLRHNPPADSSNSDGNIAECKVALAVRAAVVFVRVRLASAVTASNAEKIELTKWSGVKGHGRLSRGCRGCEFEKGAQITLAGHGYDLGSSSRRREI